MYFLLVGAGLAEFLLAGLIFGWPSLVLVLEAEGASDLHTVYTIMLVVSTGLAPVQGFIMDRIGGRWLFWSSQIFAALGALLVGFGLLAPGMVFLATGAFGTRISAFSLAKTTTHPYLIRSIYNSCFNAGGLLFYLYQLIYQHYNISSSLFFTYYAILPTMLSLLFFLWPVETSIENSPLCTNCYDRQFFWLLAFVTGCNYWIAFYPGVLPLRVTDSSLGYFSLLTPVVGLLFSPIVAYLMYKDGIYQQLLLYSLAFAWTLCLGLPASLPLHYLTYFLYALFRTLYYSVVLEYLVKHSKPQLVGRVYSLLNFINSPIILTQLPLASLNFWIGQGLQVSTFVILFTFYSIQTYLGGNYF